jgi:hypothetical protein
MMIGSRWTLWSWLLKKSEINRWIWGNCNFSKRYNLFFVNLIHFHQLWNFKKLLKHFRPTNMQVNHLFALKNRIMILLNFWKIVLSYLKNLNSLKQGTTPWFKFQFQFKSKVDCLIWFQWQFQQNAKPFIQISRT